MVVRKKYSTKIEREKTYDILSFTYHSDVGRR